LGVIPGLEYTLVTLDQTRTEPHTFEGYYFVSKDGHVLGLYTGMRVRVCPNDS
jgi:hypothetical protein